MTINVVYDHQIFEWQRYGGISRYFYEIARRVAASSEFSASIIAPLYVNEYIRENKRLVRGIHVPIECRTGRINKLINHSVVPLVLKMISPNIMHETYYSHKTSAPKGCPTVVTVHDMIYEKFKGEFPKNDTTSDAKRNAVDRADLVICVSEKTKSDLVELFSVNPAKTTVIHHGYTLTAGKNFRIPVMNTRPFLLYVGIRNFYKNFDRLLHAYASSQLLHCEFDLVAFGGGAFTREELYKFNEYGIKAGSVKQIAGRDETLSVLYQQATVFVYPSLYEGFGIPPLEAMSFNCPVVCSNTSSIPEVVGDAAQFFDPYDVGDMRDAIEKVVTSKEIRAELIKRGRARINLFSWDRCAAETMEVYKALTV